MVLVLSWIKSMSLASFVTFFKPKNKSSGECVYPKEMNFCLNPKLRDVSACKLGNIEAFNLKSYYLLEKLLNEPFFRYFKVNLKRACPFWDEAMVCFSDQCAIETLSEDPVIPKYQPLLSREEDYLNDVKFPKFQQNLKLFEKFELDDADFCAVDNDDCDGVYVDLIENPERFTDYSGPSSHKIWSSIYEENCFIDNSKMSASHHDWNTSDERKLFFRIVSGLHASISVHLSDRFYNRNVGRWESNFSMFNERVGQHPDRIQNMYLTYTLLLRAVSKIKSQMPLVQLGVQPEDDIRAKALLSSLFKALPKYPKGFDSMFFAIRPAYADHLKTTFRNMANLMDCVACERCRLWGKVQIYGVGTALKALTANDLNEVKFTRGEIVTLFNAFGRLSESIMSTQNFRMFYENENNNNTVPSCKSEENFQNFRILIGTGLLVLVVSCIYSLRIFSFKKNRK